MTLQSGNLDVNPAEETIRLGPLTLRFLVTGENSADAIAYLKLLSPSGSG